MGCGEERGECEGSGGEYWGDIGDSESDMKSVLVPGSVEDWRKLWCLPGSGGSVVSEDWASVAGSLATDLWEWDDESYYQEEQEELQEEEPQLLPDLCGELDLEQELRENMIKKSSSSSSSSSSHSQPPSLSLIQGTSRRKSSCSSISEDI